jgi:hypothetical protein
MGFVGPRPWRQLPEQSHQAIRLTELAEVASEPSAWFKFKPISKTGVVCVAQIYDGGSSSRIRRGRKRVRDGMELLPEGTFESSKKLAGRGQIAVLKRSSDCGEIESSIRSKEGIILMEHALAQCHEVVDACWAPTKLPDLRASSKGCTSGRRSLKYACREVSGAGVVVDSGILVTPIADIVFSFNVDLLVTSLRPWFDS